MPSGRRSRQAGTIVSVAAINHTCQAGISIAGSAFFFALG
jgi:hypothetical protein